VKSTPTEQRTREIGIRKVLGAGVILTLATTSHQAIRAALINPVSSLKTD
jgi:hypothetical protein